MIPSCQNATRKQAFKAVPPYSFSSLHGPLQQPSDGYRRANAAVDAATPKLKLYRHSQAGALDVVWIAPVTIRIWRTP